MKYELLILHALHIALTIFIPASEEMTAPKQEQTEQGGLQGTRRLLASVRGLLEVSSKVGVILRILHPSSWSRSYPSSH